VKQLNQTLQSGTKTLANLPMSYAVMLDEFDHAHGLILIGT